MNGCIIRNDDISIKDIYNCIENADIYNWLITNFECYPNDDTIVKILDNEYCWLSGSDLLQLLNKEDFQWIWGVFSAFPNEIKLEEVLNYDFPYADGYTGFWKNPISIQHPLAISEIVAWDGSIILVISQNNEIIKSIMKNNLSAQDLEVYNMTQ